MDRRKQGAPVVGPEKKGRKEGGWRLEVGVGVGRKKQGKEGRKGKEKRRGKEGWTRGKAKETCWEGV